MIAWETEHKRNLSKVQSGIGRATLWLHPGQIGLFNYAKTWLQIDLVRR
jgi:hypothetical protein